MVIRPKIGGVRGAKAKIFTVLLGESGPAQLSSAKFFIGQAQLNENFSNLPRVNFSICGSGPAVLSSKEQQLSPNSRFWRESQGPQAPPESVKRSLKLLGARHAIGRDPS
jgi:hypothetical protein